MHTVRNRLAQNARKGAKQRPARDEAAFMLRQAAPPQTFPTDLIVPPHRGAVITPATWPAPSPISSAISSPMSSAAQPVEATPAAPDRKRPSSKSARKAARRMAALARAEQLAAAHHAHLVKSPAPQPARPGAAPAYPDTVDRKTADRDTTDQSVVRDVPECPQALTLPPAPAVRVDPPAPAEVAHRPDVPLPSTRALVPRRQGFIDILAFALRNSGQRLSRWSSARRRADDMKDKLARAEARMRAMEAQLAALQAIQQRVRN